MKKLSVVLMILVSFSCSKQKLPQKSAAELNSVPVQSDVVKENPVKEIVLKEPISELEERLVEISEEVPEEDHFFVIIGSFRNKENALQYQNDIGEKGFDSVLLRNEDGLYRVSVLSSDEIMQARAEIHRIRTRFPEHADTWLLKKMN